MSRPRLPKFGSPDKTYPATVQATTGEIKMSTTGITIAALKEMLDLCPGIANKLLSEHSAAFDDFDKLWKKIRGLGDKICETGGNSEREIEQGKEQAQ